MGRDRKYADDAEKQRAYRQRKAEKEARERDELRGQGRPGSTRLKRGMDDDKRRTLAKMLGMLGSDNQGVRNNTCEMLTGFVKKAGLTWFDIMDVTEKKKK